MFPSGERRQRKERAVLLNPWRYLRRVMALEEAVPSGFSLGSHCRQAFVLVWALSALIPYCRKNAEGGPDVDIQDRSSFSDSSALNACYVLVTIDI